MRHLRISNQQNTNHLSIFKKQITTIFQKINEFDQADKNEALSYVRQFIDRSSSASEKSQTDDLPEVPREVTNHVTSAPMQRKKIKGLAKRRKSVIEKPWSSKVNSKIKAWLKCGACDETKETKMELLKHMELHVGTPITCLTCHRTFNSKLSFDWHVAHLCKKKRKALNKKLKCSECPKEFSFQRHLNLHVEGHKRNNCSYCDTLLTRREHLVQHMLEVHKIKLERAGFKCEHCEKWFVKRQSLFYHLRQHSPDKVVCLDCGTVSNTQEEHDQHIKKHEEQKPWQCPKCKDRFSRRHQYFCHLKRHDRYKCLTCNESYASKIHAYRHKQRGHSVQGLEPQLHCPYCPAAFHRTLLLQMHMRKHKEEETTIHCKFCDKVFHTPYQYYKHCMTISHDKNSPESSQLVCENCGKQFTKKYVLEQHLWRFHGAKPNTFACKYCDYKTQFKPNLARHVNLHFTEDKQFVCDHCGKTFSTFAVLTDHINYIHVQEKQFPCGDCDKSFKRKSELVRHQSCHSDARPHECQLCGQTYKRITHLRRHEESAHAVVNKSKRVQRLKTDSTGAVIPAPVERKKASKAKKIASKPDEPESMEQIYTLANGQPGEYFEITVPVISSVPLQKNAGNENLISLENSGFSNQEFWADKLNMQVEKASSVVYSTNANNLTPMAVLNAHGNDLQAFNMVDQLVSSLMPSKELQVVNCQQYSEFSASTTHQYDNIAVSSLHKRGNILTTDRIVMSDVTW